MVDDNHVITKSYVDQFHQWNEGSRRDLDVDFCKESNDLVKNVQDNYLNDEKLTNLDSITVNRNPSLDNELANKKYVDDSLGSDNILGFIQTVENYLKVSVGNDTYNLTKYDKIQILDTRTIKYPNTGGYLFQSWIINCNGGNDAGKIQNIMKSSKTNSPTCYSGATSLPAISDIFCI